MNSTNDRRVSGADDENIVEAEPDPTAVQIAHQLQIAEEDARFAKAEADFASQERQHVKQLREEHRWREAEYYEHDADARMLDAGRVMHDSTVEEGEANELRAKKEQQLAVDLQRMPNQNLASLRAAVSEVRVFVQNLTPADKLKVGLGAGLDEAAIAELRERVLVKGFAIEQSLAFDGGLQRQNAQQVIVDLVTFTAAVMTFADHLPALMEVVQRFGQLLMQFHF